MCSNHCGDMEVAPLCLLSRVCPRQAPQQWEALNRFVVISARMVALFHIHCTIGSHIAMFFNRENLCNKVKLVCNKNTKKCCLRFIFLKPA